ncbi:MAG: radical SAM protein [Candidatus Omnitrophica bacterium]|nr:radical SAM protein [Candidatus Omnitrophota bacterium]
MKIIFSNTFYQERVEYTSLITVIPPLDLAYCAAVVRTHIPEASIVILDANALRLNSETQLKRIKDLDADVLILTAATHSINAVKYLCEALQDKKITIILIGHHGSAFPEATLRFIPGLDIVVFGEPEITVFEIIKSFAEKKQLSSVKGIYYRLKGQIFNTEARDLLKELDSLPFPARDLLPNSLYFSPYSSGVTALQATRGCPGQCIFCDSHLINGRQYRARNPSRVVDEIQECVTKLGIKYFAIIDHTFTVKREFVEEICDGIIQRGLHRRIRWASNTRVDMLNERLVSLMKRAGCIQIGIGIESGSNRKLALLQKDITESQIKEAIQRIKRNGIVAMGYAIIGFPGDTKASIEETKEKIFDFNPHILQLSFATPLPGSALYQDCLQSNRILSDNWDDYVFLRKPIVLNDDITSEELSVLRKDIVKRFYFRISKLSELFYFFITRIHPDYLNCFKSLLKVISNIDK